MKANRRAEDNFTSFLFSWMPQQLSFILFTLTLVFFLNYLFVIQSIFSPNVGHNVRCKVPAGANLEDDEHANADACESEASETMCTSKMCQLASKRCQLTNVPRTDVDENATTHTRIETSSEQSQLAQVSALIECCLNQRTTATATVKLIDKAMPTQLIPQQRPIVTTNFNDNNTTLSPNNILNNTNTILNYSKSTFVNSHLNRTYDEVNGTINLTNAFIALYKTNSDNLKLNTSSFKYSLDNDSCIRHNSIESSSDLHQHHQHPKHQCDHSSTSCSGGTLVQCFRWNSFPPNWQGNGSHSIPHADTILSYLFNNNI